MRKSRHSIKIYQSRLHLAVTLIFVIAPFLYLLLFSRLANIAASQLFFSLWNSFGRLIAAYVISLILAWCFAVSFYRGRRAGIALPLFDVLQSFPTFASLPLVVFFWGASNLTVIAALVMTVIWPIFFSMIGSLKLIKRDWEEAAEIAGLTGFDYLRYFVWPVSVPGLITGSIIGLGEGWEALVATEIIVGLQAGLGDFFNSHATDYSITLFGILGFLIIIFSINKLIWIRLLEWSHQRMED